MFLGVGGDSGGLGPMTYSSCPQQSHSGPLPIEKTFRRGFPYSEPGVPELAGNVGMNRPTREHDLESGGD